MTNINDRARENEALRQRVSQLSAAILRINASLDVDTVLQEIVDSARALTGVPYGLIVTIDEQGETQDCVSSGFTEEEHRQIEQWPKGPQLFKHLRDLSGVMRLDDLPAYAHGYAEALAWPKTFLGTPMRYGDAHVGNFYLGEKEGAEAFTAEAEAMLVLFASQAATAIANARTHRDEQRARADLEALIDTSPVAVVVFDTRTGKPVSLNPEACRIAGILGIPGRPAEDLLDVITIQRADGREVSLSEYPVAQTWIDAETVRAEEVVLSVPDGRSVSMLLNVTPIRSKEGEVVSLVVTMQDLAPLEELDRLRAEFLGMVSHELRAPLAAIKGSAATALDASPALDPAEAQQFFRIIDEQANHMSGLVSDLLDAGRISATSDGPGRGTQITFTLPVAEEAGGVPEQSRPSHQGSERPPILVVDDDPQTLRLVREALAQAGYSPLVTGEHNELSRIIREEKPHLVLLDLLLPGADGIELMENVPELADLPVIFISAYGRDETIARALERGAVDYIVKPFSATELTARVRAALRRRTEMEPFVLGDLAIRYEQREVIVAACPVRLTATEYELLRILSVNAGRVVTYESLIRQIWSGTDSGDSDSIRTFVKQLRRKLGDDATRPAYIQNVHGVGYRMAKPRSRSLPGRKK